jgi:hypothetical protein
MLTYGEGGASTADPAGTGRARGGCRLSSRRRRRRRRRRQ